MWLEMQKKFKMDMNMKIELEEKKYEKMVMQIQRHTMRMMHKTMDSIMKTLKEKKKRDGGDRGGVGGDDNPGGWNNVSEGGGMVMVTVIVMTMF